MSRGRRRDRRVYLLSHPVLFALLAVTRPVGVLRLGRTLLVHDPAPFIEVLTRVPLDRTGGGTTGGLARALADSVAADGGASGGMLFDQDGTDHRRVRRELTGGLGAAGVARLRPVWREVLRRRTAPLADGGVVDVVDLARELAGASTAALLDLPVDPVPLARAASACAAAAAAGELPRPRWPGRRRVRAADHTARAAAARLSTLVRGDERAAMVTVAAVNTTVAGLPRAVAWCADDGLWPYADDSGTLPGLVDELLRVTAPSPLLPRRSAGPARVGDHRVRPGDRLLLVARHAAGAHRTGPDPARPTPPAQARLVFGTGPHSCPGAGLARAQLADLLAVLAPYRPVVCRRRVDRRSALPGWSRLLVRASAR